jgi:hypothetical protein
MNSNLSELKRERKHMEQDAQMLANRINFLQQEEEKTWRKIQETKRQAQRFSDIKQDQEQRLLRQYQAKAERERALSEKRSTYKFIRDKQKQERNDLKSAVFHSKQEEARFMKNQKQINERKIHVNFDLIHEENAKRRAAVSRDKVIGKVKISNFQEKKSSIGKNVYLQKMEENERMKLEKQKELENMEKLEFELIKRLQNTQVIKDQAVMELESMIRSPGMTKIYTSLQNQRKDSYY